MLMSYYFLFLYVDIPVRFNQSGNSIMHHKFCLVDTPWNTDGDKVSVINLIGKSEKSLTSDKGDIVFIPDGGLVISGSLNWTMQV